MLPFGTVFFVSGCIHQIGFVNRAFRGCGVQIGLFNIFGRGDDKVLFPIVNARF